MPQQVLLTTPKTRVAVTVADTPLDWAIDSAPGLTLTVPDPRRILTFDPGTLGDSSTTLYCGLWGKQWPVTEVGRDERAVTLTLEHPGVFGLRSLHGPVDASADITRPQFAQQLYRRSRAGTRDDVLFTPLTNPEADGKKPPTLKASTPRRDRTAQQQRDQRLAPGFKAGASFKIAGKTADDEQKKVLASGLSVADELKAPRPARLALVEALIVESRCRNLTYGDASSTGPLQVLAETGRSIGVDPRDVEGVCREFLQRGFAQYRPVGAIPAARRNPKWTSGQIAQWCQGSKFPERYETAQPEAQAILAAWSGSGTSDLQAANESPDAFSLGREDDGWTKFTGLATDSDRRAYATLDGLYWITDNQAAQSRPLTVLHRRAPGVKSLTWKSDANRQVDTVNLELVCNDLVAWRLAGHTVEVVNEGDANGTWLVSRFSRGSRKDRHATFELTRLRPFLPESAIAAANSTGATGATKVGSQSASVESAKVKKARRVIDQITAQRHRYAYGGGHERFAGPYDCSGFCSAVEHATSSTLKTPLATSGFITWGQPGQGNVLTYWIRETGNPKTSHMYLTLKSGGKLRVAESGGQTGVLTGWRTSATGPHPRPGFVPRHAEGW